MVVILQLARAEVPAVPKAKLEAERKKKQREKEKKRKELELAAEKRAAEVQIIG